jgi:hypothetical protein
VKECLLIYYLKQPKLEAKNLDFKNNFYFENIERPNRQTDHRVKVRNRRMKIMQTRARDKVQTEERKISLMIENLRSK